MSIFSIEQSWNEIDLCLFCLPMWYLISSGPVCVPMKRSFSIIALVLHEIKKMYSAKTPVQDRRWKATCMQVCLRFVSIKHIWTHDVNSSWTNKRTWINLLFQYFWFNWRGENVNLFEKRLHVVFVKKS